MAQSDEVIQGLGKGYKSARVSKIEIISMNVLIKGIYNFAIK